MEQIFCRYGTPIALLTDNGGEFCSSLMQDICRLMKVDKLRTTFYKSSTNSVVERFHRSLNSMLAKVVNDRHNDWDIMLPYVMAAYRNTRHDTTHYTPNYLMLGREVRAPVDVMYGTGELQGENESYDSYVETIKERMQAAHDQVRQHLGRAAERNKRYYDMRVRPSVFNVGDWVYYYNPRKYKGKQEKWLRKFTGPFLVVAVLGPVNYRLQKSRKSPSFVSHVDKIKPFYGTPPKSWLSVETRNECTNNDAIINNDEAVVEEDVEPHVCVNDGGDVYDAPLVDVVTFNEDQEFRKMRPRRNVQIPMRYRS